MPDLFPQAVNGPGSTTDRNVSTFMHTLTADTPSKYESDEQRWSGLMVNAQMGNESDYHKLLTELTNVIYSFLRSRFGNHHFIEDCVQDTLIAIHQARHTYDQRRPFRPWLFAIVRHKAIDTLRKQHTREKAARRYEGVKGIISEAISHNEPESEIINGRLLESLPVDYREVLVLTKIIGFSVSESAKKLGISESLVKVRVYRAIRKLSKMMEADNS